MDLKIVFKRLGFKKNAHIVYKILTQYEEPLLVGHIAKKAGISRMEVYRDLKELLDRKFIKKINIGQRYYYTSENPERIEEEFIKFFKQASNAMKESLAKKEHRMPDDIYYFTGFNGLRAVFNDVIKHTPTKSTFYRYTSERDLASVNRYLSPNYRKERDRKKLDRLVISNPISGKQKHPRLERFIKFIPPEIDSFEQNVIQIIYGDRVAFIDLSSERAFIIQNTLLADFQKVIFKQLYQKLKG